MLDVILLGVSLFAVFIVMIRKTSAGVAVLGLLAGVLLNQLLSDWIINQLPNNATSLNEYVPVVVRLIITFTPVIASIVAVKVYRHKPILSILTSLFLGFLVVYFGVDILSSIEVVEETAKKSGLLSFIRPYESEILAAGAILAVVEMVASHHHGNKHSKKKSKKIK